MLLRQSKMGENNWLPASAERAGRAARIPSDNSKALPTISKRMVVAFRIQGAQSARQRRNSGQLPNWDLQRPPGAIWKACRARVYHCTGRYCTGDIPTRRLQASAQALSSRHLVCMPSPRRRRSQRCDARLLAPFFA